MPKTNIKTNIKRGSIWELKEQYSLYIANQKSNLAIVISADIQNNGPAGIITVLPVLSLPASSKKEDLSWLVQADPEETDLKQTIFINSFVIFTINKDRLLSKVAIGQANARVLNDVDYNLKMLLSLS